MSRTNPPKKNRTLDITFFAGGGAPRRRGMAKPHAIGQMQSELEALRAEHQSTQQELATVKAERDRHQERCKVYADRADYVGKLYENLLIQLSSPTDSKPGAAADLRTGGETVYWKLYVDDLAHNARVMNQEFAHQKRLWDEAAAQHDVRFWTRAKMSPTPGAEHDPLSPCEAGLSNNGNTCRGLDSPPPPRVAGTDAASCSSTPLPRAHASGEQEHASVTRAATAENEHEDEDDEELQLAIAASLSSTTAAAHEGGTSGVKKEGEGAVEDYDGSYACLICSNSVRGKPALHCSQCSVNPFHVACVRMDSVRMKTCPQCANPTVVPFTGRFTAPCAAPITQSMDLTSGCDEGGCDEGPALPGKQGKGKEEEEEARTGQGSGTKRRVREDAMSWAAEDELTEAQQLAVAENMSLLENEQLAWKAKVHGSAEEQRRNEMLDSFQAISGWTNREETLATLIAHNWNFDEAVQAALNQSWQRAERAERFRAASSSSQPQQETPDTQAKPAGRTAGKAKTRKAKKGKR